MRARCMVCGCKSASYNAAGYSLMFHSFPRDQARRKIWRKACKNTKLEGVNLDMSKICSLHFEKKYYRKNRTLLSSATPTLNLPFSGFGLNGKNKGKLVCSATTEKTFSNSIKNNEDSKLISISENNMQIKTSTADDGNNKNVVNNETQIRSDCESSTQTGTKSTIDEEEYNNKNQAQRVSYCNNFPTVATSIDLKNEIQDTEVEIKKESQDNAANVPNTAAYDDDDDVIGSVNFSSSEDDKSQEEPTKPDQHNLEEVSLEITFKGESEDLTEANEQDSQFVEQFPEVDILSSDSEVQAIQPTISENNTKNKKVLPKITDFQTLLPRIAGVTSHAGMLEISSLTPTHSNQSRVEVAAPMADMTMDDDNEDDCSTFASHIKSRMRTFDQEQKFIALKLISDVMFMASTRQLQLGSAVVNPAPVMFMTTANQLLGPAHSSKADQKNSPANEKAKPANSEDGPPKNKRAKWQYDNSYLG